MSRVGYLGGSFNPIHFGHLHIANAVYSELKLDKIYFMPNCRQPLKNDYVDYNHRCEMIKLAILQFPNYYISYDEKEEKVHYTIDTLRKIKQEKPDEDIFFIIGEDSLDDLHKWNNPLGILQIATFVVLRRYSSYNELVEKTNIAKINYGGNIIALDSKILNISSTKIRENFRNKIKVNEDLPQIVEEYIIKNELYSSI